MEGREEVAQRLQNIPRLQQQIVRLQEEIQTLENALQELNPEERLVAEFLLVSPERGNVQRLCEILEVEQSSIYRRKEQVLEKIARTIYN